MVVIDTTAVTVALPSIAADLHTFDPSLTWVMNAYTVTFGGFLLLSGRLGDVYGERRMFLAGISLFTLTSVVCGFAHTQTALLIARAVQGFGGALVAAVSLSLITNLFHAPADRARAMAIYGFVCGAGGSIGEMLGGFVTKALNWHWIFLINLPIGVAVSGLCVVLLARDDPARVGRQLDIAGAVAITTALTTAVYALVNGNEAGWTSVQTVGLLSVVAALLLLFVSVESRMREPLIPPRLFQLRGFVAANVLAFLWAAGTFAWYVIAALYLQRVLNYDAFQVGLAFAPADVIMAGISVGLSVRLVTRFGVRRPLWVGLLLVAAGLMVFSRAPLLGTFVLDVLPGMLLLGVGGGMASTPLLLAAMSDVASGESGLASGIVNCSFLMGGALGLGALASLAEARTSQLQRSGAEAVLALNDGYHLAFLVGAFLCGTAAVLGALMLRGKTSLQTDRAITVSQAGQ